MLRALSLTQRLTIFFTVLAAAVDKDGMDANALSGYVKNDLAPALESLEGVASVTTTGQLEESVDVTLDQDKIDALNKKIQKKIDELTDAIKREPKNETLYGARGQCYVKVGEFDKAISDLTVAVTANQNHQGYLAVRGDAYAKSKRYKEAFEDYGRALKVGPSSHYLLLHQASCAVLLNDYKAAEAPGKAALELKPNDVPTLTLLGSVERETGHLQKSLEFFNQAISISPNDANLLRLRAETFRLLGRKDLAEKDFNLLKKLDN